MSPLAITALVAAIVLMDAVVIGGAIWALVHLKWNRLAGAYPERQPAPDAVSRNCQSFSFGIFNLGWSVHVAVDDDHLHLTPAVYLRWCGAKRLSVPWEAIRIVKRSEWRQMIVTKIGGQTVAGPAWCLGLAEPAPASPPTGDIDSSPLPRRGGSST